MISLVRLSTSGCEPTSMQLKTPVLGSAWALLLRNEPLQSQGGIARTCSDLELAGCQHGYLGWRHETVPGHELFGLHAKNVRFSRLHTVRIPDIVHLKHFAASLFNFSQPAIVGLDTGLRLYYRTRPFPPVHWPSSVHRLILHIRSLSFKYQSHAFRQLRDLPDSIRDVIVVLHTPLPKESY